MRNRRKLREWLPFFAMTILSGCRRNVASPWRLGLAALLLLSFNLHAADYVYDGNGRIAVVTSANGDSSQYVYDAMGNLQQVIAVPAGKLAVFAFSPNHGSPGLSVTIAGQGFSATAANNTVKFNGVPATVLSATAATLVVRVPPAATTGPLAVSVATQTAPSVDPFVVDGSGMPPKITSFSPTIAAAGTAITLLGQHLDPVAGQTSVTVNGQSAAPTSITDSQMEFPVPNPAGSGRISVETPFGLALSSSDLIVAPAGINAADIVAEERIAVGGTQSLVIPAAGKYGVLLFDSPNASLLSFQLDALTATDSNLGYALYDPQNRLVQSGTISVSAPSIHLPLLRRQGTYSIYFKPGTAAATLTVGLEAAPTLAVNATAKELATAVNNQSKRFVFSATQSQTLALSLSSIATTPTGGSITATVYNSFGVQIVSTSTSIATTLNLPNLAVGQYQVILSPPSNATQGVVIQLRSAAGGTLSIDGVSNAVTTLPGQNAYFHFSATAKSNVELALNGLTVVGGSSYATLNVYDAYGSNVGGGYCYSYNPGGGCNVHLWGLRGGSYTVIVAPPSQASQLSFGITLTRDLTGALTSGTSLALALPRPGQTARLSFSGTAGQSLAIALDSIATTPAGGSVTVMVYRPDGTKWTSGAITGSGSVNLPNLPSTGTYMAIVSPDYGLPATMNVTLAASGDPLLIDGPTVAVTTRAGQSAYLKFDAAAGSNVEIALSGLTVVGGSSYATLNVYDAYGSNVGGGYCYSYNPGGGCNVHLWGLRGGSYTVIVAPPSQASQLSFGITLTSDLTGALTSGTPLALALQRPGQTARLSFSGTAGQSLAIALDSIATTPAGSSVTVMVYRPDGTKWTSGGITGSGSVNLPNLPSTGTYMAIVSPDYGLPATMNVTLAASGDPLLIDGPTVAVTTRAGQSAYLKFDAAAGSNVEIALNGLTVAGGSSYATLNVYDAYGSNVGGGYCYSYNPGGGCNVHLWGLRGGSYTVIVAPPSQASQLSFGITLTRDLTGALTSGTSLALALPRPGQTARLSFSGTAGQSLAIALDSIATTPAGGSVTVMVYRPDGTKWTSGGITGSGSVNLPNLPSTGTYMAIVSPDYGLPATMNVASVPVGVAPPTSNTPVLAENDSLAVTTRAGQSAYLKFDAAAGSNVEIALNGLTVAGGSSYATLNVYDAYGSNVGGGYCYSYNPGGGCNVHLWGLRGGSYTVIVAPPSQASQLSFGITLTRDLTGTLTSGMPLAVSLPHPGQVARLSFNGTAGQSPAITLDSIVTTPAGGNVTVTIYRPDGTKWTSGGITGSGSVNLPNLPSSGTYLAIISPDYGLPANMNVTLAPPGGGVLTIDGSSTTATTLPGQNAYFKFDATAGSNVELALNGLTVVGGSSYATLNVYDAYGSNVGSGYCYQSNPGGDCSIHLWGLKGGSYTVVVAPVSQASQLSFGITLTQDLTGTLMSEAPLAVSLPRPGQVDRLTFNGMAGQNVTITIDTIVTAPTGGNVTVVVCGIDGLAWKSAGFANNGSITLPTLPATGTYTVIVSSNYGLPASMKVGMTTTPGTAPINGDAVLTINGASQAVTTLAGQSAQFNFTASSGDNLELAINGLTSTGSYAAFNVYDAYGNTVGSNYCYTSYPGGGCNVHLWGLAGGTYSAVVAPQGPTYTLSFGMTLTRDLTGTLSETPLAVSLARPGQTAWLSFSGTAGQTAAISLSAVTTTPVNGNVTVTILRPDGTKWTSGGVIGSGSINLPSLPTTGTYTAIVSPDYGLPTSMKVTLAPIMAGPLTINGASQAVTTLAGQSAQFSFTASPGDNLELAINGLTSTGSYAAFNVYDAYGNNVGSNYCYTSYPGGGCNVHLWGLAGGTYSVVVAPQGPTYTLSFGMTLTRDLTGTLSETPLAVSLARPGQTAWLSFSGTAGQTAAISLSAVTTTPVNGNVTVTILRPDGTKWTSGGVIGSGSINLPSLPTTGTYTAIVSPDYGLPTSMKVTLAPIMAGPLTINGASQAVTTLAGQSAQFSFTASPGDNLELAINGLTSTGSYAAFNVYDAYGNNVGSNYCYTSYPGGGCNVHLWGLAGGTYSVVVAPQGPTYTLSFGMTLTRDLTGTLSETPLAVSLARPGQTAWLSFSGTAGQTAAISLSAVTTTPVNGNVTVTILRPDGTKWTSGGVIGSGSINLPSLPTTGTYTAIVSPDYGLPTSMKVTLAPIMAGPLTINGASQAVTTLAGQSAQFSFTASPGDNLELAINGLTSTGSYAAFNVYDAYGNNVGSNYCYTSYPGGGCNVHLWGLAGGTYSVVVAPQGPTYTLSFGMTLTRDLTGTLSETPLAVSLARPGQTAWLSFSGTAGQTAAISLSAVTTTPVNGNVTVTILRPDGTKWTSGGVIGSGSINLPSLPTTGTYTAIVSPDYGLPTSMKVTLAPIMAGPLTINGASQAVTTLAGQSAQFSFTASPGDNLELAINGLTSTGSYAAFNVYDAYGNTVGSNYCYTSYPGGGCNVHLWGLAGGTYSAVVAPQGPTYTLSFGMTLTRDLTGTLTMQQAKHLALPRPGQLMRLSFTGLAGETVALDLDGVTTTPINGNVTVTILRPDGTTWTSFGVVHSGSVGLANLPANGKYTVIVSPDYGLPATMDVTPTLQ